MKDKGTIILFHPSMRVGKGVQNRIGMPLGLLAIATPLDLAGYRVKIIDQAVEPQWEKILLAELKKSPICVGISVKTGPQIKYGLEASKIVKRCSSAPVIWGGVHSSLTPHQTLENENIDIIVEGEGEETFLELVEALKVQTSLSKVKGIWYKEDGQIKNTPPRPFVDLNKQPHLLYHLVDVNKYLMKVFGIDHLRFSTSRGCPYRCAFCYNTIFYKRTWRGLTVDETIKRMKKIRDEYGVRGIRLTDDLFFKDIERVRKILTEIVNKKLDIVITKLDVRSSELIHLDDDFLRLIEAAGCKSLVIGVESGSLRILDLIKKDINIEDVINFNRRVKKFNLIPRYFFMLGFPTETEEDIRQTISLIFRLLEDNKEAMKEISIYTPYPGTELFDLSVKNGLNPPKRLEDWAAINWRTIDRNNTPWISKKREKLLKMLQCSSLFLEKNYFLDPILATNPLVVALARLYHPIAKWRVKNFYYKFPIEIKIVEWFGFYAKQV